jgi:hypothetical protein
LQKNVPISIIVQESAKGARNDAMKYKSLYQ